MRMVAVVVVVVAETAVEGIRESLLDSSSSTRVLVPFCRRHCC